MHNWGAYQFHPAFVLGFHGTEKATVDAVVKQQDRIHLAPSTKSYDWLGHGVYFWENDPARGRKGKDRVLRDLDCAVIETLHQMRKDQGLPPYNSIRATFPEDDPLYSDAGFRAKNHIQLCVLDEGQCIKGYFRPLPG